MAYDSGQAGAEIEITEEIVEEGALQLMYEMGDLRDNDGHARHSFRLRSSDRPVGKVTVSIGVAAVTAAGVEDAIEAADRNLYTAKRGGRNRVAFQLLAGAAR